MRDKQQSIYMMGIKQKDENSAGGLHNTLAAGTTVKGNIITETDFRLDGQVEGDINCNGKIVIGPKGRVTGNIISANAEVLGEVEGSVRVSEKLVLKATGMYLHNRWKSSRTLVSTGFAICVPKQRNKQDYSPTCISTTVLRTSILLC